MQMLIIIQAGILCQWTNDSQRFLLEYFDTIHEAPSHIYHSALPSSPSSSWLHKYYGPEFSQEVKVIKGLLVDWGTCSRTVLLDAHIMCISCWNNTIAVGSGHRDIITLDAITGSQIAALSGHTDEVNSVVFSSDGKSLVSGSDDRTVKLWDMQTGGVVKTFSGHTELVRSVSISVDCTTIASGAFDSTTRLWDVQTGECHCVVEQLNLVFLVCFSPTDPQYFLSVSNHKVQQLDMNGQQVGPIFDGFHVAFFSDGTKVISCANTTATIRDSSSKEIITEFQTTYDISQYFCFSPDNRFFAITAGGTAYVWDITTSEPCLVETFIGHTKNISTIAFSSPSTLITASKDQSVKFWKVGITSTDRFGTASRSISSAIVRSITIYAKDGITITSDSDGVVRTWDISTGLCKASFNTPAKGISKRDVKLVNGRLVLVWHEAKKIRVWDVEKEKPLLIVDGPDNFEDLKLSEDGSRVFSLGVGLIQAQSVQTGEIVSSTDIVVVSNKTRHLTVDGSRVWVQYSNIQDQVWDFGAPGSSPVQLPSLPLIRIHPNGMILWDTGLSCIREDATGRVVFWLSRRYGRPIDAQWDGQYLVACFISGED